MHTQHKPLSFIVFGLAAAAVLVWPSGLRAAEVQGAVEGARAPFFAVIEAESMSLSGDWRVAKDKEGHCPAYPQFWSGNRLRGGAGPEPAEASQEIEIPADGTYAVWVRYESPYGFDVLFDVAIHQDKEGKGGQPVYAGTFGDRNDLKSFYGNWRVQEAWAYHNADFVCQKDVAELRKGKARVVLSKGYPGKAGAVRMIDLIAITDDLESEQGRRSRAKPWDPTCLVDYCKRPGYLRVQVGKAPARAVMSYGLFSAPYGIGFTVVVPFTAAPGLTPYPAASSRAPFRLPKGVEHEALPAGFDSGWRRFDLSTLGTADIRLHTDAPLVLSFSREPDGRDAVSFEVKPDDAEGVNRFIVATGFKLIEEPMMGDDWALRHSEISRRRLKAVKSFKVPGKPPVNYRVQVSGGGDNLGPYGEAIKETIGRNTAGYEPDVYRADAAGAKRINRAAGGYYFALHNSLLNRSCYEGDYSRYETALNKLKEKAAADGLGELPWLVKLIEEAGPPALATMRDWPVIADRFRAWLKERNVEPAGMLGAAELAAALKAGETGAAVLWPRVLLSDGSIQAAAENPELFYLSKIFAGELFIDNLAQGVKLIEKILPKGSAGDLGCAWTQDGHGLRLNWYDEMMLFRRRGATAFGTENTWGLCGLAHYIGPQTESYQGALARACAKYHPDTRLDSTTAVFGWHLYGYPAEYTEMVAYALAANGARGLCFATCGDWATDDLHRAWKRAAYAIGGVEEQLFAARNVPARVALGWSETTTIWDQAVPTDTGFNRPGNVMSQLERHYVYLMLRHMQLPIDLLSDADIEEGRLKDYDVYWMVGDHTTRRAADQIRQWVEGGGVLVSGAGGGLLDEFNRPLDTLTEVYGIKGQRQHAAAQGAEYIPGQIYGDAAGDNRLEKLQQALRAKLELIHAHPADWITLDGFGGGPLPVLGQRQRFTLAGGGAAGTLRDGSTAVVTNAFGKGRAVIAGFLPGTSYFYQAFPKEPYGRGGEDLSLNLYPQCRPLVREAMAHLLRAAWPAMVVPARASHPLVEASLLHDGGRYYIALVNFSGEPIDALQVTVDKASCGKPSGARAAYGKLGSADHGDTLVLTLPLDKFEWIALEP